MSVSRRSRLLTAAATLGALAVAALIAGIVVVVTRHTGSAPPPPGPGAAVVEPQTEKSPPPRPTASPRQPRNTRATAAPATRLATFWGIDVSWPQCGAGGLPDITTGFVTVGVNGGRPFTDNPCLADQVTYARAHSGYAAYLNLDAPRSGDPTAYGRRAALDGLARARAAGLRPPTLWLDVEVLNHWADGQTNVAVINGAIHALQARHVGVGIYSSVPMWQQITGGSSIGVPVWLATTVTDYKAVDPLCRTGLGGRPAVLAQYVASTGSQDIDVDVLCPDTQSQTVGMFAAGSG